MPCFFKFGVIHIYLYVWLRLRRDDSFIVVFIPKLNIKYKKQHCKIRNIKIFRVLGSLFTYRYKYCKFVLDNLKYIKRICMNWKVIEQFHAKLTECKSFISHCATAAMFTYLGGFKLCLITPRSGKCWIENYIRLILENILLKILGDHLSESSRLYLNCYYHFITLSLYLNCYYPPLILFFDTQN